MNPRSPAEVASMTAAEAESWRVAQALELAGQRGKDRKAAHPPKLHDADHRRARRRQARASRQRGRR